MPEELPVFMGMGDRDEAIAYVHGADSAWTASAGARDWLAAALARGGSPAAGRSDPAEDAPDPDRIDEAVLALLLLGLHDDARAWKGFDWDAMDRLHRKGLISDPKSRAKSIVFSAEGLAAAEAAHRRLFVKR